MEQSVPEEHVIVSGSSQINTHHGLVVSFVCHPPLFPVGIHGGFIHLTPDGGRQQQQHHARPHGWKRFWWDFPAQKLNQLFGKTWFEHQFMWVVKTSRKTTRKQLSGLTRSSLKTFTTHRSGFYVIFSHFFISWSWRVLYSVRWKSNQFFWIFCRFPRTETMNVFMRNLTVKPWIFFLV